VTIKQMVSDESCYGDEKSTDYKITMLVSRSTAAASVLDDLADCGNSPGMSPHHLLVLVVDKHSEKNETDPVTAEKGGLGVGSGDITVRANIGEPIASWRCRCLTKGATKSVWRVMGTCESVNQTRDSEGNWGSHRISI